MADTLDLFASYKAETLVPQYGPVIQGATEVNDYLTGTSTALRYLDDQVVDHLNAGHNLNETIATMVYPPTIFAKAFLGATFGSLEDVVRSIWATYNGWWDRNPTDLRSVPQGQVGAAIRSAISDRALVLQRAAELQGAGEHRLALHVVDLLALAPGEDADIVLARKLKAALCYELADREEAYIAQSLYLTSGDVLLNPPTVPTGIR